MEVGNWHKSSIIKLLGRGRWHNYSYLLLNLTRVFVFTSKGLAFFQIFKHMDGLNDKAQQAPTYPSLEQDGIDVAILACITSSIAPTNQNLWLIHRPGEWYTMMPLSFSWAYMIKAFIFQNVHFATDNDPCYDAFMDRKMAHRILRIIATPSKH